MEVFNIASYLLIAIVGGIGSDAESIVDQLYTKKGFKRAFYHLLGDLFLVSKVVF